MDASMMKWILVVLFIGTTIGKSNGQNNKVVSETPKLYPFVSSSTISPTTELKEAANLPTTSALTEEINHTTSRNIVSSLSYTIVTPITPTTTPDAPYSVTDLKVSDTKENSISLVNVTFKYPRVATGANDHFVITYEPLNNTESSTTCQSINPNENTTGITVQFENKTTFSRVIPVTADTLYRLTVEAFNGEKNSIATLKFTKKGKASDQVTNLNVTEVTSSSAQVQWSPPRYPKGNIFAYEVRVENNNRSCTVQLMCRGNEENNVQPSPECQLFSVQDTADTIIETQVSYRLHGLTPYTNYSVDVLVINSYGKGCKSAILFETSESAPEKVQKLNVLGVKGNSSEAEVTFNCPHQSNGKITYYWITYEALNNTNTTNRCQTINPTENKTGMKVKVDESHSCNYSVLVPVTADTKYDFQVSAVNMHKGRASNILYVAKTYPSDPVTDLNVTHVTSTNATVLWSPPFNSRGNILSYEVGWSSIKGCGSIQLMCKGNEDHDKEETNEFSLVDVSPECKLPNENTAGTFTDKQLTYRLEGLTPYTNYSVDVLVKTSYGKSKISRTQFKTSESEPEGVRKLNVSEVLNNSSQAEVSFQCPQTSNGKITYYWIMYEALENTLTTNPCQTMNPIENKIGIKVPADESHSCDYSVTVPVTEETQYLFKIFAANTFNGSSVKMTYRAKAGVPGKVVSLNVTQLDTNYTAATVSFYSPQNPNGIITKYVLSYFMLSPGYTDSACEVLRQITNMTAITIYANSTENCLYSKTVAISPETTYSIQVAAFNSHKGPPAEIHYTTRSSVPGSIKAIKIYNVTCDSVMVTWEHPSQPNGFLKGYRLQLNRIEPNIEECFKAAELSCKGETISDVPTEAWCNTDRIVNAHMEVSDPLSYQFKELCPFTSYELIIKAVNRNGSGESSSVHFNTAPSAPGPVTSLSFSSVPGNFSDLNLHFTCLAPDKRHGNITHYTIKYIADTKMSESKCGMSPVIQNTSGVIIDDGDSCSFSRRVAVTPEIHYNFSIQAFNSLPGKIAFYEMSTPYGTPDEVRKLKAVARTSSSVTVQWATPQHVNGMIHSYQLSVVLEGKCIFRHFTDCGDFNVNQENRKLKKECKTNGTTPSIKNFIHHKDLHNITVNDLLSYTKYTISVVPKNTNGSGPEALLNFTTNVGVPDEPQNFNANVNNSSTITLLWSPSKHQAGPTNYTIIVNGNVDTRTNNCTDVGTINVPGFHTSSTVVDNLCSYTNYAITIMAITSAGNSSRVSINQTVQTGIGIPDEPNNFYANVSSSATITLFWSPSEHQAGPTKYIIDIIGNVDQKKNNCIDVNTINVTGFHTSSIVVDNLCSYTNYSFTITAITSAGKSSCVSGNTVKTHTEAADPPHGLRVEKVTPSSVELSWVHSKHQCGLTDYIVEVEERSHLKDEFYIPNGTITVHGFHNNTVYIGNLISYWKYNFSVRARTSVNPVSSSIYAEVQTSQSPPGVVKNIQVSALPDNYTAVKLTWECPEERERHGPISSFTVQYPDKKLTFDHFPDGYPCRKPQIELHSAVLPVHPEKTYEFTVFASAKYEGWKTVSVSFCAKAGKPPKENSTKIFLITPSVTSETTTESTFPVTVNTDLLRDSTNGRIVMIGLLVMKDTAIVDVPENFTLISLMNWRGWKEWKKDYKGTYRPTPDNWLIPQIRRKRSTDSASNSTTRFIVGNDNCESKEHCNGPVEADTTYRVIAVSCTNVGCSSSTPFGPFRTKAKSVAAAAVGGVLAALVVVGIVIGGLVYRRQRNRKRHHHGDDPNKQEEGESVNKTRPKKLSDFSPLVDEYHKDSGRLFAEEWREIGLFSPSHPYENATLEVNREKNRYTNILAYDQTRVKLLPKTEDDGSDYINANFILGFSRPREYIASQGPVPGTLEDFWQMIWEQNVPIIVQLTDLYEGGRRKLSRYWPEEVNVPETFGEVQVETVSLSPMNKYTIKVFNVSVGSKSRQVKHFFLQGWQDYNANLKTGDVIDFARYVRNELKPTDKGPMVVHCSAGVGRTGTFICVDYFLQVIDKADLEDSIDIFSFVLKMRDCRPLMVQSESQYVFVHDAVKEMIERKKKALAGVDEVLYENQAFDPEDDEEDNIYENT